jgi:hypothetical protein
MIKKLVEINNKRIEIFDNVFSLVERDTLHDYAVSVPYRLSRLSSELPQQRSYPTLKADVSISDLIKLNFFNPTVLSLIKDNNLRFLQSYINLGTCGDTYFYHIDSSCSTDKTLIYYVNVDWPFEWEGETHFSNEELDDIVYSSAFKSGRVLFFDATIPHKSSQPSYGAKTFRYTLAIKLTSPNSHTFNQGIEVEDLLIKDFETTVDENRAIEFIKTLTEHIHHSQSNFFVHCLNTFKLLKSQGRPSHVCLAGLFHSVYGTEFVNPNINITRDLVQQYIGKDAEELVKLFCDSQPRQQLIYENVLRYKKETHQQLLYIEYANLIDQYLRTGRYLDTISAVKTKLDQINRV